MVLESHSNAKIMKKSLPFAIRWGADEKGVQNCQDRVSA